MKHLVKVTELRILLLALFVWTFTHRALGSLTINAILTCSTIATLAFLRFLKYVGADHALVKHLGVRFIGLGYKINGNCHLL